MSLDAGLTRYSATPLSSAEPRVRKGAGRSRRVVALDIMYREISSGISCWISDIDGAREPLPIGRWLGGDSSTHMDRVADEALLQFCTGPTIDVGCGPGRFTAALADRGVPALGVDISATAVEMTRRRGGRAIHQDVFAPVPAVGQWSQVLLADGNIGIGGNPLRILRRARQLLHPRGLVVAEIEALPVGVTREHRRWETDHAVGRWFPWTKVGIDAAGKLAEAAGFGLVSTREVSERCLVTMRAV